MYRSLVMPPFPPGFAAELARVLEPGAETEAAAVLEQAAGLDDRALERFLSRLARRVRRSPRRVSAGELRSLLAGSRAGRPPA